MKRPSLRILSAGAIFGLLSMTPAFAQVAGNNPGDLHTQTLYMQQYHELRGYTARAPDPPRRRRAAATWSMTLIRANRTSVTSPSVRFSPSTDLVDNWRRSVRGASASGVGWRALRRGWVSEAALDRGGQAVMARGDKFAENQKSD
jgi:hypothetical protein